MMRELLPFIMRLGEWLEYWGGARDAPPYPARFGWFGWGLWWGVLLIVIWMFSGQDSKFIYIDF
jgi:hypothetical protein